MQITLWNNKIRINELTNEQKLHLRRTGINVSVNPNGEVVMEDNFFNRTLLGLAAEKPINDPTPITDSVQPCARDYQKRDIEHMLRHKHNFNQNKPGYGKTFESIEYCRIKDFKNILILCPKSVVEQWKDQFCKWWPEVATYIQALGDGPKRSGKIIYIINYEQLRRKEVLQRCKMWCWDIIICDESHRIKNQKAKVTLAVKDLPSVHRMCLTGTPILGHPDDLWSQLHFLDPYISGKSYWAFTERFCEIEEDHFGKKPIGLTPSDGAKALLTKVLSIISVGGENQNVTKGKNIIPIELTMDKAQRNLYKNVVNLALDELEKDGITVKNAMDQVVKQQQITTNCTMFDKCKTNPKFEWIKDWLEDNEGEKVVIFTKFAETAKTLHAYLSQKKIVNELYIGELSARSRLANKNAFIENLYCRVLIGTIGAMGVGVDGLQQVCSNVIFLDRDWTPGLNEQAEDRVNRSGQIGFTNVWILNMKNSIDQHVEQIQGKKASDIKEVFNLVARQSNEEV